MSPTTVGSLYKKVFVLSEERNCYFRDVAEISTSQIITGPGDHPTFLHSLCLTSLTKEPNPLLLTVWKTTLSWAAKKKKKGGFPGGTVVKNLPANAGDMGSSPGPGRPHMTQSN